MLITHDYLCDKAFKWLKSHKQNIIIPNCSIISRELVTLVRETPDVIGWSQGISYLIECKTSLADFKADKKKYFRATPNMGMGDYRYFLAPKGLLKVYDLPEGWGLLELSRRSIFITYPSYKFTSDKRNEIIVISSIASRAYSNSTKGIFVKKFTPMIRK